MIPKSTAARLIAGMLQGKLVIGPAWDSLAEPRQNALILAWEEALRSEGNAATTTILMIISNDKVLGPAWRQCRPAFHEFCTRAIEAIASSAAEVISNPDE